MAAAFLAAWPLPAMPKDQGLAQSIMTTWTDREGLPSNTILDVVQDNDGYIWLGSYEGLVRFDGASFTTMSPTVGGFDGRSARVLKLGPDGALWVGTNAAGLYVRKNGAFYRYGLAEGLPDLSVRSIAFDVSGALWVGTAGGVSKMAAADASGSDPAAARFEPASHGEQALGIANFVLPLPDGTVLVGSNLPGLRFIGPRGVELFLPGQGLEALSFSAAYLDGSGGLWLGSSSGQVLLVSRNEVVGPVALEDMGGASINGFFADSEGTLWLATDRGIVAKRGPSFDGYSEADGLPSNVVSSLWRDRERNLWVGTERGGLVKFSPGKFVNTGKADGLVSDAVNGAAEDGWKSLWVATDDGVSFMPSADDPYVRDPARKAMIDAFVDGLRGVRVRQARGEPDGSMWFSTYSDRGLIVLESDGRERSLTKDDGLPNNRVRFSYRSPSGALWIGTTAGPVMMAAGKTKAFGVDSGLPNLFILCAKEDARGTVWLGTDGGGVAAIGEYGKGNVLKAYGKADGLAGNVVFRIVDDAAGRLWFCTSEGLSLYENDKFMPADAAVGLSGESVFEVIEDSGGRLWIITGQRIVVIDADTAADAARAGGRATGLRSYDRLDGLSGQLSANAWAFINDRGVVYLPTLRGLSTYNPQSAQVNTLPPPVIIERIDIDGLEAKAPAGSLVVQAGAKRVTFSYTALSYTVPQRVRFQYMLEGFDADWISAGARRDIGYTNLPPGRYAFRVRATNNDGIVNEEGASVSLEKLPFFYQRVPFYIALAVALAGAGFLVAYLRVLRLKRRADELDRLVAERTRELAEEKEKSDGLLRNILPESVAEQLKETGKARPQVYADATVLFADIVGFTQWSSPLAPDAIIEELNALFTAFDDIMDAWDCERIKTIGDGYLACCGLADRKADHPARMAGAAVDMLRYVDKRNESGGDRLRIRIGIDSGAVVGGVVGIKKYIFDVFGDAVNTAFRLEGMSAPMGLTVSATTAPRLGSAFTLQKRPLRQVKGKGVMESSYVVYRSSVYKPIGYSAAKIRYGEIVASFDAEDYGTCLAQIGRLDSTILEPEMARDIESLEAKIAALRE